MAAEPHVLSLTLQRLNPEAMPRLLEGIWRPIPKNLADFIYRKSDGVPLFATELARLLHERFGSSSSTEREWEQALHTSGVSTLQDLIATRFAGLGRARRVAQIASVVGREFSYEVLLCLMERHATDPAPEEELAQLVDRGIIRRRHNPEGLVFRFRHVLLHEAAYDSLLKAERYALHTTIVDLVVSGAIDPPADEIMAWHCQVAGRPRDAALYAIQAAESCAARSAPQEADRLLQLAEEQLAACREDDADELRIRLLAARGPVAIALYGTGSAQARATYDEGVQLCQRKGVADRERWLPLFWGWWFTAPDQFVMRQRATIILSDLDAANDPEVRLQAYHCAWAANFHAGRHGECLHCIEQGLELYDPQRAVLSRTRYGGHDAKVCGLAERGLALWLTGQTSAARRSVNEALHWAEEIGHVGSLCHAIDIALMLHRFDENHSAARDLAERLAVIAERHSLPAADAKSRIFRGWASGSLGNVASGLHALTEGLELQRAIGTDEDMPVHASMAAELLAQSGRPIAAISLLEDAIAQAERAGNVFWVPELHRAHALLLQPSDPYRAGAQLLHALSLAQSQGASAIVRRIEGDIADGRRSGEPT
jgi:predicted ATPase